MESLHDTKILKFNPDTLVALRKMYNLDKPGQMDEAIDLLNAWVNKQNHFVKKDYSREYLERVIILLKGSVERAKGQLDKICTLRTLLPQYFEKFDAKNDFNILKGNSFWAFLPRLTKDNIRVLFLRFDPLKTHSTKSILYGYFYNIIMCEYLKANDYSNGLAVIADVRGINIVEFMAQLSLMDLKQICTIYLEGYDTRAQNFFFLSTSKTIDVFVKVFKSLISEKLGKRVHVFKEVEELHKHIPKEMLPSDYGGNEKSLAGLNDDLVNELATPENIKHFREMSKFRTNESMRVSNKYHENFEGLAGTFRTLSVD